MSRIRGWVAEHCPERFAEDEVHVGRWVQLDPLGRGRWRLHGQPDAARAHHLTDAAIRPYMLCG